MPSYNRLDFTGLSHFWDKVKTYISQHAGTMLGVKLNGTTSYPDQDGIADLGSVPTSSDLAGKADKVDSATSGNFAGLDGNGNLVDSGHKHSDYLTAHQDISGKADKVNNATSGNFAGLDANGNMTDSGSKASDFLTQHQDISGKADKDTDAVTGNLAKFDSSGNPIDSGKSEDDFVAANQGSDNAGKALGINSSGAVVPVEFPADISGIANVSEYGAVGDGTTDDSEAIQAAVDANYDIYFESNKTYYLASTVTIDHDVRLHGGENTVILTKTPSGGTVNDAIVISGTLKTTTTLTGDYTREGYTDNSGNRFELTDMSEAEIGDIMVVCAEDQYYSYARQYYYLGAALLISDINDGHIYTADAMPWDIDNSNDVSVKIYSAPAVVIENLKFVSDTDSGAAYRNCLTLNHCRNSVVRNCEVSEMDNGVRIYECVNVFVDCVTVSQTGAVYGGTGDHYGVSVYSCSNTSLNRIIGVCGTSCIDMSGQIPNINTRITNCNLVSESRQSGFGMHENAYNTLVEDCVLGGMNAYGTITVNRCRFINNNRINVGDSAIVYRGDYNPDWSSLILSECSFEEEQLPVSIDKTRVQTPIQAYVNRIGRVEIRDCTGGLMSIAATLDEYVTGIVIDEIIVRNWKDCYEIYRNSYHTIRHMEVIDSTFVHNHWMNDHANHFYTNNIDDLHYVCDAPEINRRYVDNHKHGGRYYLPAGVHVTFSSSNADARYAICGNNYASNIRDDYAVGTISGSAGAALSRIVYSQYASDLTVNSAGNLVYSQSGTAKCAIFTYCMAYVVERSGINASVVLKDTGETSGQAYYLFCAVLDASTGLIRRRPNGTGAEASAAGTTITISTYAESNSYVLVYIGTKTVAKGAETTFENYVVNIVPYEMSSNAPVYEQYQGVGRTGDGSLATMNGLNNIMSSELTTLVHFTSDCGYIGTDISGKADKVPYATSGHLAGLDSSGNLADSGYYPGDFVNALFVSQVLAIAALPIVTGSTNNSGKAISAGEYFVLANPNSPQNDAIYSANSNIAVDEDWTSSATVVSGATSTVNMLAGLISAKNDETNLSVVDGKVCVTYQKEVE